MPVAAGRATMALKFALAGFVALSIGYAVYKAAGAPAAPGAALVEVVQPAAAPVAAVKPQAAGRTVSPRAGGTAVVYYFYTNTRCSSCKTIEAYTREAVSAKLAAGYKDWKIEFKGVNVDEEANAHFVQDYWLNSKSVVVQKFTGDKKLNWGKLDKVWQLLGDKDAFINYVADETHKLLDAK